MQKSTIIRKEEKQPGRRQAWWWVPSVYFTQGLPYIIVMSVAPVLYKRLGLDNIQIAFYTGWLYLPWVIKPLWSPVIELFKSKRWWIVTMQLVMGGGLAGVGLSIPLNEHLSWTLIFFWLLAFSSATHDIAVDGIYMLGLGEKQQASYVGIRSTCYRIAMLAGQGGLVVVAGLLEKSFGEIQLAWTFTFMGAATLFVLFCIYHAWSLPRPQDDVPKFKKNDAIKEFYRTFLTFFSKKKIGLILSFILLYRLGESQLTKIAPLFLLDEIDQGGLGLQTTDYGIAYGTLGLIALLIGGVLGGLAASRHGLKPWIWGMLLAMNLPNLVYIYLAYTQPESLWVITFCVALEQLGYGFGFTGLTLFVIHISKGAYQTAHYAIGTGFWALGMMLPGMFSGWLQDTMGYPLFFAWVTLASLPIFFIAQKVKSQISLPSISTN